MQKSKVSLYIKTDGVCISKNYKNAIFTHKIFTLIAQQHHTPSGLYYMQNSTF